LTLQHQLGEAAGAREEALGKKLKLQQQLQELQQQLHELQRQLQEAADCGRAAEAAEQHSQRLRQQHTQDLERAAQQAQEAHEVESSQKSDRCWLYRTKCLECRLFQMEHESQWAIFTNVSSLLNLLRATTGIHSQPLEMTFENFRSVCSPQPMCHCSTNKISQKSAPVKDSRKKK